LSSFDDAVRLRSAAVAIAAFVLGASAAPAQQPATLRDSARFRAPVRICAGGDVTLGTNLNPVWAARVADSMRNVHKLNGAPDSLIARLRPMMAGADIVMVNIEGAIGSGPAPRKCGPTSTACYAFRQDPPAAAAFRSLTDGRAVVVGNLANNHSHDAGAEGVDTTVALLDAAGVIVTGVDTLATPLISARGDTLAFLGFHTSAESPDARDLAAVRRHVARAVQHYGTVIVTMHLGAEGVGAQRTRNVAERLGTAARGNPVAFANTVFAAGATLIIGHGPHVLRAGEWRDDRLVLYSLGNLLTYGPFNNREPMNRGAVACASIEGRGRVTNAELRPTVQLAAGVLEPDPARRALRIIDSLSRLDFPRTGIVVAPNGAITKRPPPRR
jgi:hypothetical protein